MLGYVGMSRFFCYNTNSGRALAEPPELLSKGHPGKNGGGRMAKNEKGRSFFEWATLIVKLLTACAALIAAVAELIR